MAIFPVVSLPALAAVYRYELHDGRIVFPDAPGGDAAGRKPEKFSRRFTKSIAAAVSHRRMTRLYIDGYACRAKPGRELTALLYARDLSERRFAIAGEPPSKAGISCRAACAPARYFAGWREPAEFSQIRPAFSNCSSKKNMIGNSCARSGSLRIQMKLFRDRALLLTKSELIRESHG